MKKNTILNHISTQIILIVGITVVLVLSIMVMFFYNSSIRTIRDNTIRSNEIILEQINNRFEEYIKEIENFALNVRMDSNILSILECEELDYMDQETVGNYMKAMFYSRHDLYDISVYMLSSNTKIKFSRDTKKVFVQNETNIEQNSWFQFAAADSAYAYVAPLETQPRILSNLSATDPFLRVYRVIINAYTKEPLAAVEITCTLNALEYIFEDLKQDHTSKICLTDSRNTPYFISDLSLLELVDSPQWNSDDPISLDGNEFLIVNNVSRNRHWYLTKFISIDRLSAQNIHSRNISLVALAIATIISLSAIACLVHFLTLSLRLLAKQMYQAGKGDLKTKLAETGCYETRMLAHQYNLMITMIDDLIQKNYVMELNEKAAKIQALESQINPHFLYNSLQVISSRTILTGDRAVYNMIEALAANLRYSFKESELVPVDLEVQYIRNYLLLLKARFDERLVTNLQMDSDVGNILIPKISVFTMLENSIIHGLEASMNCLCINIAIQKTGDKLVISVSDNGPGIQPEELKTISSWLEKETTIVSGGAHVGLKNLNARLKLYFKNEATVKLTSIPDVQTTTTMTITIPTEKGSD